MKSIYLIGSLRNPQIPDIGNTLRDAGFDVLDDWYGAGEIADDSWKAYELQRGRTYQQALQGRAANHIFAFDKSHLDRCEIGILVCPAGRSGHLELGYMAGSGKRTYILVDNPDRWDLMYKFADAVCFSVAELLSELARSQ